MKHYKGDVNNKFTRLEDYIEELRRSNNSSSIMLETKEDS